MKVQLIEAGTTQNPVEHIGRMAAICYDGNEDPGTSIKRAYKCKDDGHLTTLRFAHATVEVSDISRVCSHQLVRMAHAGLLQSSQRYVKQSHVGYIDPPALGQCSYNDQLEWAEIQDRAELLYLRLIDSKAMKKEDARYILPQGCTTSIRMCLNYQAWEHFFKLRCDKHAQWEIRKLAEEIRRQLNEVSGGFFDGH